MQPWLRFEAPMASVSTLGLPCFSSGWLEPASDGSNQVPVERRTTARRMQFDRRAAAKPFTPKATARQAVTIDQGTPAFKRPLTWNMNKPRSP